MAEGNELQAFMERISAYGLAEPLHRYYSVYRARVDRIDDPEQGGRIQVTVGFASMTTSLDVWLDPVTLGAGGSRGMFWPPEVGDMVWAVFQEGDTSKPLCYFGSWFGSGELPEEFAYTPEGDVAFPDRRGFVSRMGHRVVFNDTPGSESLEVSWHQPASSDPARTDRSKTADRSTGKTATLLFSKDNVVLLTDSEGQYAKFDAANQVVELKDKKGNVVHMDSNGIRMESPKEIVLKAPSIKLNAPKVELCDLPSFGILDSNAVIAFLRSHVHTSAPPGVVTSIAVPPPVASVLTSTKVKGG